MSEVTTQDHDSAPLDEATQIAAGLVNLIMQATEGNFLTVAGKQRYASRLCEIAPLIVDAIVVEVNAEREASVVLTDNEDTH